MQNLGARPLFSSILCGTRPPTCVERAVSRTASSGSGPWRCRSVCRRHSACLNLHEGLRNSVETACVRPRAFALSSFFLLLKQAIAERSEIWCLAVNGSQSRLAAGSSEKFVHLWALEEAEAQASGELALASFLGAVPRSEGQGQAVAMSFGSTKDMELLLCQGAGRVLEARPWW